MDAHVGALNKLLGCASALLVLVSTAPLPQLAAPALEVVGLASLALQGASEAAADVAKREAAAQDALALVRELQGVVRLQRSALETQRSSRCSVGVGTDQEEEKCGSCELLRKALEAVEGEAVLRAEDFKRREAVSASDSYWKLYF
jgi:hypothetical protein